MTTPLPESAAADLEAAFIDAADGNEDPPPLVRGSINRLIRWVFPAGLVIAMISAIPGVLVPFQIELIDPANKELNLALVLSVSGAGSLIAGPIAGQISDRTRSRFGRRTPWIVIGSLVVALALVGMAFAGSVWGITIAWFFVQVAMAFVQGPFSAILPDRVPLTVAAPSPRYPASRS
ncbi:MFS transporter [Microbacterium sp. NPDC019599]|uniref:MFS transporter n=1 Tax=Microbacterium sp. NPDC019599 TaxID=3154690 RepID=UPI0033E1CD43